ncbi:MAG: c-type cytochrome [Bacteroidales bacterium]|nr:c-type cytochrome [Bacteroidales bacterium]
MEPNNHNLIEKDELTGDNLISGHEYDGIKELDNKLPKWWLWLFYITIIISGIYFTRMHILHTADKQDAAYAKEVETAMLMYKSAREANAIDATNVTLLTDAGSLAAGKAIFDKSCVVCHLAQGQGLVGPNLTDEYWIHGCSIGEIFNLIVVGVPDKGMISWKDQLTPEQIQQVSSFIVSLNGTNPPNPKPPQGEVCSE